MKIEVSKIEHEKPCKINALAGMQTSLRSDIPKCKRKIRNETTNHLVNPSFHALFSYLSLMRTFIERRKRFQSFERKRIFFYCIGPPCRPPPSHFEPPKGDLSWTPNHIPPNGPSSRENWPCVRWQRRPAYLDPATGRPLLSLPWRFEWRGRPSKRPHPVLGPHFRAAPPKRPFAGRMVSVSPRPWVARASP